MDMTFWTADGSRRGEKMRERGGAAMFISEGTERPPVFDGINPLHYPKLAFSFSALPLFNEE
jgi:hypothetical protein